MEARESFAEVAIERKCTIILKASIGLGCPLPSDALARVRAWGPDAFGERVLAETVYKPLLEELLQEVPCCRTS